MACLAEQMREPSFADDEFEKLQKQKLAESQQLQGRYRFASLDRVSPGRLSCRSSAISADARREDCRACRRLRVADVKAFHANYFGPKYCTMVVVGDVAPATDSEAEVAIAFADWKGGRPLPQAPASTPIKESKELTINVPGKESVSVILGAPSGLRYADAGSFAALLWSNQRAGARLYAAG